MLFKSISISKILLLVLALVLVAIMIKLGYWQLDRSAFKAEREMEISQRLEHPVKQMPLIQLDSQQWRYYQVNIKGQYLPDLGFLVDNVVHESVVGVSVVTPFEITGSDYLILVNRGWQPWGADRQTLPQVQTPAQQVELSGRLVPATEDHFYLQDPEDSLEPSQLWPQLDLNRFIKTSPKSVQPLILVLDTDQAGSYQHIVQFHYDGWVARHQAYAIQWFALALTLTIITIVLSYKFWMKKKPDE